jgi:DNA-binding NarL/FixJ family response regulator
MAEKKTSETEPAGTPPAHAPTRVLIVDDHQVVRWGVRTLLESEPDLSVCGEAGDAITALQIVREEHPDLAVIDLSLDEGNGLELIKRLKSSYPSLLTIVLSMHDEKLFAERSLRAGAMGYVSKHAPARTILTAIRQVLAGQIYLSEQMTAHLIKQAAGGKAEEPGSPMDSLSDRELDVFRRLGQGLSIHQIAEQLHLSPKTVGTYRDRIRQKLGITSSAELSRHAYLWTLEHA